MTCAPAVKVDRFKGLNNREPETRIEPSWLRAADNIELDDQGDIRRCDGANPVQTGVADIYRTRDGERAYKILQTGQLTRWDDTPLFNVGNGPYHWTDIGNITAVHAERPCMIYREGPHPWGVAMPELPAISAIAGNIIGGAYRVTVTYDTDQGRESGALPGKTIVLPDQGGIRVERPALATGTWRVYITPDRNDVYYMAAVGELTDASLDVTDGVHTNQYTIELKRYLQMPPLRRIDALGHFDARLWLALYDEVAQFSRLFASETLDYHYFRYDDEALHIDVPGQVHWLADAGDTLLVGSSLGLYAMNPEYAVQMLAPFGATQSRPAWDITTGMVYVSTHRGLVSYPPMALVHDEHFSMERSAGAALEVRRHNGFRQALLFPRDIVSTSNPRTDYLTPEVKL